jgi:uncharacterized protein DUF6510
LREVLVQKLSAIRGAGACCETIAQMGGQHLYLQSPGAVLRCNTCQEILIVFVHAGGRHRLGPRGPHNVSVTTSGLNPSIRASTPSRMV